MSIHRVFEGNAELLVKNDPFVVFGFSPINVN